MIPPLSFWWLVVSGAAGMYEIWAKGPHVPEPPRERRRAAATLEEAVAQARHDEVVRLAHEHTPTTVPGLIRPEVDNRLIVSMPVYLYERRRTRHLVPVARVPGAKLVWPYHSRVGKTTTITPVDHGTLYLTRRQFIYVSAKRRREFPLHELTHMSATSWSIALATRGSPAISYFKGISMTSIHFQVVPSAGDSWPTIMFELPFTGYELSEIVTLMTSKAGSR